MTDQVFAEIFAGLDQCDGKLQDIHRALSRLLADPPAYVPDWVVDQVVQKWNEFNTEYTSATAYARTSANRAGRTYGLRDAADAWTTTVAAGLSGLSGTVDVNTKLVSDDEFSGDAAEAYKRSAAPRQQNAIAAIEKFPAVLAGGCNATADGINDYAGKLFVALMGLVAAMASFYLAAATAGTVVGAVFFICTGIAALAVFVGAIVAAELGLYRVVEQVEDTFLTALANWEHFEKPANPGDASNAGDNWPPAGIT
jgi:hypothetical protein